MWESTLFYMLQTLKRLDNTLFFFVNMGDLIVDDEYFQISILIASLVNTDR